MILTKIEKLAILKVMETIINADGIFHDKEKIFLLQMLNSLDMTIGEASKGTNSLDLKSAGETLILMSKEKREYAKDLFLKLSIIDGNFHPNEVLLLAPLFSALE